MTITFAPILFEYIFFLRLTVTAMFLLYFVGLLMMSLFWCVWFQKWETKINRRFFKLYENVKTHSQKVNSIAWEPKKKQEKET